MVVVVRAKTYFRDPRGPLTALIGAMAVRLVVLGEYRLYLKSSMGPWLLIAGLVLVVASAMSLLQTPRRDDAVRHGTHGDEIRADHDDRSHRDDHDEHEAHAPTKAAWLLLAPVLVLVLVPPGALSSSAASRINSRFANVDFAPPVSFSQLESPDGKPVPLSLDSFNLRAIASDAGASMTAVPLQLEGFVTVNSVTDDVMIARYSVGCCAADAIISFAALVGPDVIRWPLDTWVRATGYYEPDAPFLTLSVQSVTTH
jgi:uncharacterized repeat protein (TIGR03943 family)